MAPSRIPWPPPTSTSRPIPPEVVGGDHVRGLLFGPGGHRGLERRLLLGMAAQVVEEPVPVDVLEGRAAVADGGQGPGRRLVVDLTPGQHRPPHRPGRVRPEALAELGEGEAAALLGQDLLEHQPPQGPGQQVGIGPHGCGELGPGPRPLGQHVGHPEPGRHIQQLGGQEPVGQPPHPHPHRDRRVLVRDPALRPRRVSVHARWGSVTVSCGWRRGRRPGRPAHPRRPGPRWPGRGTRPGSGRPGRRGPAGC